MEGGKRIYEIGVSEFKTILIHRCCRWSCAIKFAWSESAKIDFMELFKEKRLEMNNYKSFIEIIEIDLLYPDLEFANPML